MQLIFYLNGESQPKKFNMIVDNDCMEVTAAIISQLRNVLPSAPKEYVCPETVHLCMCLCVHLSVCVCVSVCLCVIIPLQSLY